ncbi:MAG: glutamine-hydrolyzing GMP synthase, partial [Spirochaetia bacterium]|nr:glutamine-hydrolyzing GMP synthase [Spirochaetia bacterium]
MEASVLCYGQYILMDSIKNKKIAVLDFGGQYAHLIASRLRRLGAYSEIIHTDIKPDEIKKQYSGIIFSGGPSSVYEQNAPVSNPEILNLKIPVLGICYGHQLIMHQLGGTVESSSNREYGPADLQIVNAKGIFESEDHNVHNRVWMSHGDEVKKLPEGFDIMGSSQDCLHAAVGNVSKNIYGLQFHPEVNDTIRGDDYLKRFIRICGLENTYSLDNFLEEEIQKIKQQVGDKKVFLLVSGGVDSTVAFALLAKALPEDHLLGLFVDTGFMRKDEIEEVSSALRDLKVKLEVENASSLYFQKLKEIYEPEIKRNIIGELFIDVQESVTEKLGLNPDEWFLAQGTIYPDTIESGATKNSNVIKTHHNRVKRIQDMLEKGNIVEPLRDLYKDEVRRLGILLGLPEHLVMRHPFPGPGLAVRCLCNEKTNNEILNFSDEINPYQDIKSLLNENKLEGRILPVKSVGVQGDKRSYAHPIA